MKKKLAFFLCVSDNIAFAAGNVALSLNKYMQNKQFDIVIYHTALQKDNFLALSKIPKVILKEFNLDKRFVEIIKSRMPEGRFSNPNSMLAFAHYEIFDLLYDYQTVIWLDVDISIQMDISELINYGPFGQCKDINGNHIWTVGDQFIKPLSSECGYDMNVDGYINALVVVNDQLPKWTELREYCYKKSIQYAEYLKNCDQCIFGLMIQDYSIKVNTISWFDYICHANHEYSPFAKIVHFGYKLKIWNSERYLRCFPEWFRTHIVWLELGGCDFDRSNMCLSSIYLEHKKESNNLVLTQRKLSKINIKFFGLVSIFRIEKYFKCNLLYFFNILIFKVKKNQIKLSFFLFNFCEIFKILRREQNVLIVFFFGLPFFYVKNNINKFKISLLKKLELFKIRKKSNVLVFYIFGIPFFIISRYY